MNRPLPVSARPRVLLVDDDAGVRAAVTRWLARDCDVVGGVADGRDLLDAAARLQPDVILIDLNLADVNGLDVCRQVSQTIPQARVIVLSADDDGAIRHEAFAAGAVAFVAKQQITEGLLPAIARVCADRTASTVPAKAGPSPSITP